MSPVLAAAAVAAFNLVCSGTNYNFNPSIPLSPHVDERAFMRTYRIDLDSGRWCLEECRETKPLYGVSETQILLAVDDFGDENDLHDVLIRINRETGELVDRLRVHTFGIMYLGKCAPAPFSGFPARKF